MTQTVYMGRPGDDGRFGDFGGRFVPEALMPACLELETAFIDAWSDPEFVGEYRSVLAEFGGRPTPEGLWYEPTVIVPVSNESEVVQHEIFGPVLTLQRFATDDEAVALANSTAYGLSAIIYTSDEARAQRIGQAVRAGTVWVNCFLVRDLTAPFGGIGISGVGREGGDYALDFYSDLQMLQIKEGTTHG